MPGLDAVALIISTLGQTVWAANALYLGTYALVIGGRCDACQQIGTAR